MIQQKQILISTFSSIFLLSCFPARVLKYNLADINDLEKFESVAIKNHPTDTFQFNSPLDGQKMSLPDGFDFKTEEAFTNYLSKTKSVSFLVIQNDTLIYESYFKGYDKERYIPSFSVSKSFVSALLGIAIEEGKIKSASDPISDYVPEFQKMNHISIQDVLDMQAGFQFGENYFSPFSKVAKYYYGPRLNHYLKKLKANPKKHGRFKYQSVNTQVLAKIIENATGQSIADYLESKLWQPLKMESSATWSVDDSGTVKAFCCINATSRDFAKLGRLYLNSGEWNGNQLVPKEWVAQSLYFDSAKNEFKYSMHWWHNVVLKKINIAEELDNLEQPYSVIRNKKGKPKAIKQAHGDTFARGVLGQYIYIHPEKKLIIVRMGKGFGFTPWNKLFKAIAEAN